MVDLQNPKAQQAEAFQREAAWDGHILACCGEPCSSRGWGICCLTFWLPCITHGLNLAHLYTAQKVCLFKFHLAADAKHLPCWFRLVAAYGQTFVATAVTVQRACDLLRAPVSSPQALERINMPLTVHKLKQVALGVLLFVALCYVLPCIVFPAVFVSVFRAPDIVACEVSPVPPPSHRWLPVKLSSNAQCVAHMQCCTGLVHLLKVYIDHASNARVSGLLAQHILFLCR